MLPERFWRATYFDGHTAARYAVEVRVDEDGLTMLGESIGPVTWRYDTMRQSAGLLATDPVRFERGGDTPEVLVIDDGRVLEAILALAPGRQRFVKRARGFFSPRRTIAAAAALVLALLVAYFWGVPTLANSVAAKVPVSWEEKVGSSVAAAVAQTARPCNDPAATAALERIVQRLAADGRGGPYTYRVSIVDDKMVNALAAPGGYIVVFRGLLESAQSADEVAGVLAHEMQHVVLRHSTRQVLREVPFKLIGAAIGESAAIDIVTTVGAYRYGRADERAADREGLRTLRAAGISPNGLIAFFERLQASEGQRGGSLPAYLSTHPSTASRVADLRALAGSAAYTSTPALDAAEWAALHGACRVR
ncbi:MAG TPA: M48 family metallopeptidase [Gemmatimonadaceae bacterium]|nr:M48 family metallopeptidase [Gemmatimonadaceae bacterium]